MNNCLECNKETKNKKYCSRSCSAKSNNRGVVRNGNCSTECLCCGKRTGKSSAKYCSHSCQHDYQRLQKIKSGNYGAKTAKAFILKERGRVCEKCNLSNWNGEPIPIELDHIDGNHQNNSLDNLRLLCPNCHAQTATYKIRNIGNGRKHRRKT